MYRFVRDLQAYAFYQWKQLFDDIRSKTLKATVLHKQNVVIF